MKDLKTVFFIISILISSTLFSQITPKKDKLKTKKTLVAKKKLPNNLNVSSLKIDNIDSLSIKERNDLNIPKGPILATELLSTFIVKTSWRITPEQLNDRDLVFTKMYAGMLTPANFDLMPREEFGADNYIPSYISLNFRERIGKQYLLEIDMGRHSGGFSDRELLISINNKYQVYEVINNKVNVVWVSNSNDIINLRITQNPPVHIMYNWEIHRYSDKIKSIKIRDITE